MLKTKPLPQFTGFMEPYQLLKQGELDEGMIVADLGCGSGHIAFAAAYMVGESGLIYAVDIQRSVLSALKAQSKILGLRNLKLIWADLERPESTKITADSVDVVLIINVVHQIKKTEIMAQETKRILKPSGKVLFVEWINTATPMGPEVKRRVSQGKAKKIFLGENFRFLRDIPTDNYHYGFLFQKE